MTPMHLLVLIISAAMKKVIPETAWRRTWLNCETAATQSGLHGDKGGENGCFSMSMSVSFSFLRRVTSPAHVDSGSLLIRVAGHIVPEYSATAAILHITHASYIHISVATCHTGASAKAF